MHVRVLPVFVRMLVLTTVMAANGLSQFAVPAYGGQYGTTPGQVSPLHRSAAHMGCAIYILMCAVYAVCIVCVSIYLSICRVH